MDEGRYTCHLASSLSLYLFYGYCLERFSFTYFPHFLLILLLPVTILSFPLLALLGRGREHLRAHVAKQAPDAVVPGVLFIGIAHHILSNLAEFFQKSAIRIDALIGWHIHEAIPASNIIALCGVGMRAGDQGGHTGAKSARLL